MPVEMREGRGCRTDRADGQLRIIWLALCGKEKKTSKLKYPSLFLQYLLGRGDYTNVE